MQLAQPVPASRLIYTLQIFIVVVVVVVDGAAVDVDFADSLWFTFELLRKHEGRLVGHWLFVQ